MPMRTRLLIFAAAFLAAVIWVSASGGENATVARHFLRNLLQHLF